MDRTSTTSLNKKLCILILIGLPASGKSTFAKAIEPILLENQISIEIISYDEYYVKLIQNNGSNNLNNNFDPQIWHESRKQCFASAENITENFNAANPKVRISLMTSAYYILTILMLGINYR
jgi:tRNA uridine 5-carbamoylmethylation protein Kti12